MKKIIIKISLILLIFFSINYYYNYKLKQISQYNRKQIQTINNLLITKNDSLKFLINNNNRKIENINKINNQLFKLINQNKPVFNDTLSNQEMINFMQQFIIKHKFHKGN